MENSTRGAAIVTGGGSGIGRAVALALAADGWAVSVAGRRREPLEETARAAPGGSVDVVVADVRDTEAVRKLFADIGRHGTGRVDLLFNNAGVSGAGRALTQTPRHAVTGSLLTHIDHPSQLWSNLIKSGQL